MKTNPELDQTSKDELVHQLVEKLLDRSEAILDSLDYALQRARSCGGTLGHKYGPRVKYFKELEELAKAIHEKA